MRKCPRCGKENPEGFRYCGFCAADLAEAVSISEERKVVTVLFCDLVGFTARSDRADPEDVRAVLRPYHARLRQEIEHHSGTAEKFIGDAVVAVFGAPAAHEDDAARAVRSGLGILEGIAELNAAYPGLNLAVRTGIATGEALVSLGAKPEEGESIVAGDVVNLAARLQQEATPGTVIVEEVCYRATRHLIDYEELPLIRVKGKADPVAVWRALGARTRPGVHIEPEVTTPFIGRRRDLGLLQETYRRVVEGGGVQLMTIIGEPGVGKTRLLFELRNWVHARPERVWWRQGRCLPYGGGITFWALGEVIKAHAGILESDDMEKAEGKLLAAVDAIVEEGPEQEWIRSRVAPLIGARTLEAAVGASREESFTAWRRFLEAAASVQPLILLFEDMHWADKEMLGFVEHLVDWSTGVPIFILCTARPEFFQRVPGWSGGKQNSATITLLPLSPGETTELIAGLLLDTVLPSAVESALLDRAGGNPLFAEEFVRMLLDQGILERRGGDLKLVQETEMPVPETVQALIAARLDLLPPQRKSILQDASVVGKVFWSGAVTSMRVKQEPEVLQALKQLAREEFIRPARISSIKDQDEYSFWHILVRDVAYRQIPRALRARKHRATAQWIEQLAGERVGDFAEILAAHYTEALELAQASGDVEQIEVLQERAARFLLMSGDRSFDLDVQRAEVYYRRAHELLPDSHTDQPSLAMKVARAGHLRGRPDEAKEAYRTAIALYSERRDWLGTGESMVELADLLWEYGDPQGSRELIEEAVPILERGPPSRGLALAYLLYSRDLWGVKGREKDQLDFAERGLALARDLDVKALVVRGMSYRAGARIDLGETDQGLEEERLALATALSLGLGDETARLYNNVASDIARNDLRAGLDLFREGIEFAERRGLAGDAMYMKTAFAWRLQEHGEWHESLALAEEVAASSRDPLVRLHALLVKGRVLLEKGYVDEVTSLVEEVMPQGREAAARRVRVDTLLLGAHLEAKRGRLAEAQALIEEVEQALGPESIWDAMHVLDVLDVLWILLRIGDDERTRAYVRTKQPPRWLVEHHAMLTAQAILAEAEGRLMEGVELHAEAASRWREFGFVRRQGEALLGASRCLIGLDRPLEAKAKLDEARNVFEPLGAHLFMGEIDALLEQITTIT